MIKTTGVRNGIIAFAVVLAVVAAIAQADETMDGRQIDHAVAVLHPTEGSQVSGTVIFTKVADGVRIEATVEGLEPGKHGFHIHELGDCSAPDGTSAGGHYNPDGHPHAGPDQTPRHMGDLGNLEAGADGRADYERIDDYVTLNGAKSIVGLGIIVHAGEDDFTSQPTGAAGGRLACGVIGITKP
jgi:Cu-Zn family superoxide dismutase